MNGTLNFRQEGPVTYITGTIQGLDKDAQRGMHIQSVCPLSVSYTPHRHHYNSRVPTLTKLPRSTFGDLTNGCNSTGLHYNPLNVTHGGLGDNEGHVGDLGNIQADDQGVAHINITSKKIRLDGRFSVLGCVLSFPERGCSL